MSARGERTRAALLAAGLRLAETSGLASLRVDAVVDAAGVAKGTFYVHFRERRDYLVALHREFHDALTAGIEDAQAQVKGPRARLRRGIEAYLDGCLAQPGVKALLLEARAEASVVDEVQERNRRFSAQVQRGLRELGWTDAAAAARLVVAMTAEAALAELEAGHRRAATRRALWAFLDR